MLVAVMPLALGAQDSAKPAAKAPVLHLPSKWDIFVGYSYNVPRDRLSVLQPDGSRLWLQYNPEWRGLTESASYFFSEHWGVQVESGQHDLFTDTGNSLYSSSNSGILTIQPGVVYRHISESGKWTEYLHGLGGAVWVDGPSHEPYVWGYGFTGGGALDYGNGCSNHRISYRIIQADYEYFHIKSGEPDQIWRDEEFVNGLKLSTGLVFHLGGCSAPVEPKLACAVSPATIFPGDPVTVTATGNDLDAKLHQVYEWSGTGVRGAGTTATVSTAGLSAGTYTVKAVMREGKPGKEGLKSGQIAGCSAEYTVKPYEPPTVSCSVSPSTIKPGEAVTVTATGVSPQNRPLTYSYTSASGAVSGSGNSATFNSAGAPTGVVRIGCEVTDDKGQTATAGTSVTITAPYVAPLPHTQALCSISFSNDKKRPTRVDNEAKACLDEVALALQKQSDARAVVVGEQNAGEVAKIAKQEKAAKKNKNAKVENLAAERAVNTREYLVTEKGIDASRITAATGAVEGQTVEDYLVPAGATFGNDVVGTVPVNEAVVKPQARKPLPVRPQPRKKAHKAVHSAKPPVKAK